MLSDKSIMGIAIWFLVVVAGGLLTGWVYAVKTSWQNEARLTEMSADLKGIKRSLIRLSIMTEPGDPSVATELLSGSSLQKGIGQFKAGEFPAAYATWSGAAARGDGDAVFAIFTANAELEAKLNDPNTTRAERAAAASALRSAPEVIERNGAYVMKDKN